MIYLYLQVIKVRVTLLIYKWINRLSKSTAMVDCNNFHNIWHLPTIKRYNLFLHPMNPPLAVICSNHSTLAKVMSAEASDELGFVLSGCSFGPRHHHVKKPRTAFWRIRAHMEQKWTITAETPWINQSANNRCMSQTILSHPAPAEILVKIRNGHCNENLP